MAVSCSGDEFEAVDLNIIPATALNVSSRMTLSWFLNPEQSIRCTTGAARDYRGLAELMDFEFNDIRNFQRSDDPTSKIIDKWEKRPNSTIGQLITFLEKMERFDIIQDITKQFKIDALAYLKRCRKIIESPIQVPEVTSCRPMMTQVENPNALTISDAQSGSSTFYDAYVCYSEEDTMFVYTLAAHLEEPPIGLKLFIKGRDLILGAPEPDSHVKLIQERCNRMLIILSPEFLTSPECEFQTSFAAGLAIEQRRRKLIPIVIKPCEIPLILKYISKIDFTKAVVHSWLWEKLVQSIKGISSSIFVSAQMGAPIMNPMGSQPELAFQKPSDPLVTFPETTRHALQPSSTEVPALPSPVTCPDDSTKSVPVEKVAQIPTNVSKHTSSKSSRWLNNIRERITSLNSSTPTSQTTSSTATSGYQSQSTSAENSEEI